MPEPHEQDYVLGTHDEELQRLGLQHQAWRPTVLKAWRRAGISQGSVVIDVGAGPGYATLDLADLVGPTGRVIALERSARFVQSARAACHSRGMSQVTFHELDLMIDPVPEQRIDAAWCRWVACFVSSPSTLIEKIANALRPGGVAVFHEYINYASWLLAPRLPLQQEFVQKVMSSWRAAGGEPDIALELPYLLKLNGMSVRHAKPRVFCVKPTDFVWRWPASFLESGLNRLIELKQVSDEWAKAVRLEFHSAQDNPDSLMLTPTVLEIIAEKK